MDIKIYSEHAYKFNRPMSEDMQLIHAALGVTSEAGEVADAIKANLVYGKGRDTINIVEELGDLLWFVNLAAQTLEIPLSKVLEANLAKLGVRYDEGFSQAKALGRTKELERAAIEEVLGLEV